MEVYVIGTRKNYLNAITDFVLLDIENNNNITSVTYEQLKQALVNKKIEVKNMVLVQEKTSYAMRGKYYSLQKLNSVSPKGLDYHGILVLKQLSVCDWLCVDVNKTKITVFTERTETLNAYYIQQNVVINVDENGKLLCEKNDEFLKAKPINRDNALDKEAFNENIVWDIKTFDMFMKSHNWAYYWDSSRKILGHIDPACTVVHLPAGVRTITQLFDEKPINRIEKIIINQDLHELECVYTHNNNKAGFDINIEVGSVYFQSEDTSEKRYNKAIISLTHLNIRGKAQMPDSDCGCGLYNWCYINQLEWNKDLKLYSIYDCLNNIIIGNSIIELSSNIQEMANCFVNVDGLTELSLNSKLSAIHGSFNNCKSLVNVDFSNCRDLDTIVNSFVDIPIKTVDLRMCNNLKTLQYYAFSSCKNLKELLLPNTRLGIYSIAVNSPIEKLYIPDTAYRLQYPVGNCDTQIIFGKGRKIICPGLLKRSTTSVNEEEQKIIQSNIANTDFEYESLIYKNDAIGSDMRFDSLSAFKFTHKISKLDDCALSGVLGLKVFDSADMPKITEIPEKCFKDCLLLETVILDDNIKSIGNMAFKKCCDLKNLVLGANVGAISTSALSDTEKSTVLKIYVVKGSKMHSKFTRAKNNMGFAIVEVNSVEEAREMINVKTTDEKNIAKYKLMLPAYKNGLLKYLLKPEFFANIEKLYNITMSLLSETVEENKLVLDTSKFTNVDIDIPRIHELHNGFADKIAANHDGMREEPKTVFIALSNLFTRFLDSVEEFYEPSMIKYIREEAIVNYNCIAYIDKENMIGTFDIKVRDTIVPTLIIIVNNKIRFMTIYSDKYLGAMVYHLKEPLRLFLRNYRRRLAVTSLSRWISANDVIDKTKTIISGVRYPSVREGTPPQAELMEVFENTYRIVGLREETSKMTSTEKAVDVVLYDVFTQQLVEANIYYSNSRNNLYSVFIKNIYSLSEVEKLDSRYFNQIYNKDLMVVYKRLLKETAMPQTVLKEMYSNAENFDTQGNQQIIKFADAIYKNNIDRLSKLTVPQIQSFLNTQFFESANVSLKDVQSNKSKYITKSITPIGEYNLVIAAKNIEIKNVKLNTKTYLAALCKRDVRMNDRSVFKEGFVDPDVLISILWLIGHNRQEGKIEPINRIRSVGYNSDEFMMLRQDTVTESQYSSFKKIFALALDRVNGDCYILVSDNSVSYYPLLRFKDYKPAVNCLYNMIFSHMKPSRVQSLHSVASGAITGVENPDYADLFSQISQVREFVIKGMPNGFIDDNSTEIGKLLNAVAKQPADNS